MADQEQQQPALACANCGEPATVKSDGVAANQLGWCDKHKPDQSSGLLPV